MKLSLSLTTVKKIIWFQISHFLKLRHDVIYVRNSPRWLITTNLYSHLFASSGLEIRINTVHSVVVRSTKSFLENANLSLLG